MRYPKPYYQACQLQEQIMQESTQRVEGQPNKHLANLAKSFATLEVLKLRIRMKPAPKAVDVAVSKPRKSTGSATLIE